MENMENLYKSELSQNLKRILKGSAISFIITIILLFLVAILLTYTNLQENIIKPIVIIISVISILIGSSISTLKIKKNGFINGGIIGLIYIISIYLLSSMLGSGFSFNIWSVIMIMASILAGIIGGIIGINIK